jgi:hypothetical protein
MHQTLTVRQSILFSLQQGKLNKKLFKVTFSKTSFDLFISFPYFLASEYHCGIMTIPAGLDTTQFNAVVEARASIIPLKFSYHPDGQVHFKPTDPTNHNIPLSYKLAERKSTPITELHGGHAFTIQLEGLDNFQDDDGKVKRAELRLAGKMDEQYEQIKIVVYIGTSENEVLNKYGDVNPVGILNMSRDSIPTPVHIAFYLFQAPTIQNDNKSPYLLCFGGFDGNADRDKDLSCVYLYGKVSE